MQGTLVVPIVALTLGMAACGRQPRVEAPAAVAADTLPLSPGTQIASHVSGGIGGVDARTERQECGNGRRAHELHINFPRYREPRTLSDLRG